VGKNLMALNTISASLFPVSVIMAATVIMAAINFALSLKICRSIERSITFVGSSELKSKTL
jgi:hypothetical protein